MREKHQKQFPILEPSSDHPQALELEAINEIIDDNPIICEHVMNDRICLPPTPQPLDQ